MQFIRIKPIPALAALASLALVPAAATALAPAARGTVATAASTPVQADDSKRSQIDTFRFGGGTALEYFEQARAQLTEWARGDSERSIPNIVLLPGLDRIKVPPVSLAFVINDAEGRRRAAHEMLGAITNIEIPLGEGASAYISRNQEDEESAIRIVPEFRQYRDGSSGMSGAVRASAPEGKASSVVVLPIGTVGVEAALGAASAAIKLAGLGDRTELMVHEQSGTILARTTREGESILIMAIEAAKIQRQSLDRAPAIEAARAHELQAASLQFRIERLEGENRQLNALLQVREREIVEMNRALVKLETALQQATQAASGKQP